jgi:hypothetical protein
MPSIKYPELHHREWLRRQYEDRGQSIYGIADHLGCAPTNVAKYLRKHGIPLRSGKDQRRLITYRPRACGDCGVTFQPASPNQSYCLDCRPPWRARPVPVRPCLMTMPAKPGSNGRLLLVRCQCLGRYGKPLGEAASLREARELWDAHCAARTERDSPAVAS